MTASPWSTDRDVVPQWRPFGRTVRLGELAPHVSRGGGPIGSDDDLEVLEAAYRQRPGLLIAGDLLSQAWMHGYTSGSVSTAAEFVLGRPDASASLRNLAEAVVGSAANDKDMRPAPSIDDVDNRRRVGALRAVTRKEPRNSIRRVDLALAYVAVGDPERALREMTVALQLSPSNRFVLRSATRFFIHVEDAGRAVDLLDGPHVPLDDPWVLSGAIAAAEVADRRQRHMRRAMEALSNPLLEPWHITELASEVATQEFRHGRDRDARKLMNRAMVRPNVNSLAQREWVVHKGLAGVNSAAPAQPLELEAGALNAFFGRQWASAVSHGMDWLADQPFASEAAIFTSYAASVGAQDYHAAARAALIGLDANPGEPALSNNLAFALANLGDVAGAEAAVRDGRVPSNAAQAAVAAATQGLIAFRSDRPTDGRKLYLSSISELEKLGRPEMPALASIFHAREEVLAGSDYAEKAVRQASELVRRSSGTEVAAWWARLNHLIVERRSPMGSAAPKA